VLAFNGACTSGLEGGVSKGGGQDKPRAPGGYIVLTALPEAYFFSVPITRPERWAAFRALLPLTTVSRGAGPERCLVPMRVTESQSLMVAVFMENRLKARRRYIGLCGLSVESVAGEEFDRLRFGRRDVQASRRSTVFISMTQKFLEPLMAEFGWGGKR
jgi:hypothetical protein